MFTYYNLMEIFFFLSIYNKITIFFAFYIYLQVKRKNKTLCKRIFQLHLFLGLTFFLGSTHTR